MYEDRDNSWHPYASAKEGDYFESNGIKMYSRRNYNANNYKLQNYK